MASKEYNFSLLQKLKNQNQNQNQNINEYITRIGENGYVLVINNSLPDELYNKLKDEYISLSDMVLLNKSEIVLSENNNQKQLMMSDFLYSVNSRYIQSTITPLWNKFVEYHKSSNFFNDILDLKIINKNVSRNPFEIEFNHHSPVLYKNKNTNSTSTSDLNEVKNPFLGYYFLRDEKDNSKGFNLEIYNTDTDKRILSIPYQKNTFVLICNNEKNLKIQFSDKGFSIYSKKYIKLCFTRSIYT
jgi:hypothetical protein